MYNITYKLLQHFHTVILVPMKISINTDLSRVIKGLIIPLHSTNIYSINN